MEGTDSIDREQTYLNIGPEGAELENGNGREYRTFLERNQLFAVNTYGDTKQSRPTYYGETSTRP